MEQSDTNAGWMPSAPLGQRIRSFRDQQGLSQKDFGSRLGVTQQTVARWEAGGTPTRRMGHRVEAVLANPESGQFASVVALHQDDRDSAFEGSRRSSGGTIGELNPRQRRYIDAVLLMMERGEPVANDVLRRVGDNLGPWPSER